MLERCPRHSKTGVRIWKLSKLGRTWMGASEGDWVLLARKGLGYCQWVLGTQREDKRVVLEEVRSVKKRHEGASN